MAYEDFDLEKLHHIHEAIVKRWIKAHALQQQSFAAIAANVSCLLDGNVSTVEGYDPDAFEFRVQPAMECGATSNDMWPEVTAKETILNLKELGVTVKNEGARVIICKDGSEETWLKTPSVARQVRAYENRRRPLLS